MAPTLQKPNLLHQRAQAMKDVRAYFDALDLIEVDCPALSMAASIDAHIDPMQVFLTSGQTAYLHTSPEYAMKRLLSLYNTHIYSLCHVFRDNEEGDLHSPEFTLIEWYRINLPFETFIEETLDLIRLFLGPNPATTLTYKQAFLKHLNIDPFSATPSTLAPLANHPDATTWDKDTLLQLLFTLHIEPNLQALTVITDYPATQAALARLKPDQTTAERFEIYYKGIELANGFHELADAAEQRLRLHNENRKRIALGKEPLSLDEDFLAALEKGLPDCCGVAAGFDRLLMLKLHQQTIHTALPLTSTCEQSDSACRR